LLAKLYELSPGDRTMAARVEAEAVSLNGNPSRIMKAPIVMKLFFGEEEDTYAELYTSVDVRKSVLQIHEKDPEYREPLLRSLGGAAPVVESEQTGEGSQAAPAAPALR